MKNKGFYQIESMIIIVLISTVKSFLKSVEKVTFLRMPGEYPRKLSEEEAYSIQDTCSKHLQ